MSRFILRAVHAGQVERDGMHAVDQHCMFCKKIVVSGYYGELDGKPGCAHSKCIVKFNQRGKK